MAISDTEFFSFAIINLLQNCLKLTLDVTKELFEERIDDATGNEKARDTLEAHTRTGHEASVDNVILTRKHVN